jgi:hypothetical protein
MKSIMDGKSSCRKSVTIGVQLYKKGEKLISITSHLQGRILSDGIKGKKKQMQGSVGS